MADPQAALATQLRNIEARTGQTLAQLRSASTPGACPPMRG